MDLLKMTKSLKSIKGQRLASWLQRFLVARPENLSRWTGTWTEVNTAKVVEILRKRGVIEEHEMDQSRFGLLVNACYRAPVLTVEAEMPKSEKSENVAAPNLGELLREEMGRQQQQGPEVIILPRNPE